jgi:hypothetical protein
LLGIVSCAVYVICRIRYVGDCDSWAYFAQSQVFLGRDPGLHSFPNPLRNVALTPLGMDIAQGRFVSAFPPGYSLLMALAGLVGGEYWVNPVLGGLSVVLVYFAVSRDVRHGVAFTSAALWAVCPIVAMNATDVMSDMTATVAALGSYVCLRSRRVGTAGLVFGLSMMVRPMNLLFSAAVPFLLPPKKVALLRFLVMFAAGALASAGVHWFVWGGLLSPTYHHNVSRFLPKHFVAQFPPYLWQTLLHLGPVLALALYQGARSARASAAELAWFVAFVFVYPFAGPIDIDWTRPRFLMPAYPALFVLAARGLNDLLGRMEERSERSLRVASIAAAAVAATWGVVCVARSIALRALAIHPSSDPVCDAVAARLPKGALVGAGEYSGSLRLYAGIETFDWLENEALPFAKSEFLGGRQTYLLLEPDTVRLNTDHSLATRFTVTCDLERQFSLPDGYVMHKIVGVRERGHTRIVLADQMIAWALVEGWASPTGPPSAGSRAVYCNGAKLKLLVRPDVAHDVELLAAAPEGGPPRVAEVWVRGRQLARAELGPEFAATTFRLPKELASDVRLEIRVPGAPSCDSKRDGVVARVRQVDTRIVRHE